MVTELSGYNLGPGRTGVKNCLFYQKIRHHMVLLVRPICKTFSKIPPVEIATL